MPVGELSFIIMTGTSFIGHQVAYSSSLAINHTSFHDKRS